MHKARLENLSDSIWPSDACLWIWNSHLNLLQCHPQLDLLQKWPLWKCFPPCTLHTKCEHPLHISKYQKARQRDPINADNSAKLRVQEKKSRHRDNSQKPLIREASLVLLVPGLLRLCNWSLCSPLAYNTGNCISLDISETSTDKMSHFWKAF